MPIITSIKSQKRSGWFNVEVDGKFTAALSDVRLAAEGLVKGMELTDERLASLIGESAKDRLWMRVLSFISYRPRSRVEVERWLVGKRVDKEKWEELFNRLNEEGWVDDLKFAKWWVEQRLAFRPKGRVALRMELKQKGVGEDVVSEVLNDLGSSESEGARTVAEKWLRKGADIGDKKMRDRLMAALTRRGYPWSVVREVIDGLKERG